MLLYTPPKAAEFIPVIDLSTDALTASEAIHRACRDTGFFYVSHHGVAGELVAAQFAMAQRFFDLPLPAKMALDMRNAPSTAGYEPIGAQKLDSQDAKAAVAPPDLKESFYCMVDLPDGHPMSQRHIRGFGHNQWPAELPEMRPMLLDYQKAMQQLGNRILSLLALSLSLEESWFEKHYQMPVSTVRLIKYPPQPGDAQFNQIGAGAHTDWGGITILAQDDVGGLEVRNTDGEWLIAKPIPGTFVVNLGDLMARWSNGIYNSNLHRVNNNMSGRDRYSIATFYSPNPDAVIEPMPTCVSDDNPQRFAVCTAAEHISEMFKRSYGYAAGHTKDDRVPAA